VALSRVEAKAAGQTSEIAITIALSYFLFLSATTPLTWHREAMVLSSTKLQCHQRRVKIISLKPLRKMLFNLYKSTIIHVRKFTFRRIRN